MIQAVKVSKSQKQIVVSPHTLQFYKMFHISLTYPLNSGQKNRHFIMLNTPNQCNLKRSFDHILEGRANKYNIFCWFFGVCGDTKISF